MNMRVAICIVCTEESDEGVMAVCLRCGEWYHLNPYATRPGRDCGIATLGDEETGIDYVCNTCIEEVRIEIAQAQRRQNMLAKAEAEATAEAERPAPSAPPARTTSTPPRRRFRRIDQ